MEWTTNYREQQKMHLEYRKKSVSELMELANNNDVIAQYELAIKYCIGKEVEKIMKKY